MPSEIKLVGSGAPRALPRAVLVMADEVEVAGPVVEAISLARQNISKLSEKAEALAGCGENKHVHPVLERAKAHLDHALDLVNGTGDPDDADPITAPEAVARARSLINLADRAIWIFTRAEELSSEVMELGTRRRFLVRKTKRPYLTISLTYINDACVKVQKACEDPDNAEISLTVAEELLSTAEDRMDGYVTATSIWRKAAGGIGTFIIIAVFILLLVGVK